MNAQAQQNNHYAKMAHLIGSTQDAGKPSNLE
jgi:hypothetical protein